MFLPLGDYPNPSRPQWVTRILIGINVAVFLLVNMPLDRPVTKEEMAQPEIKKEVERIAKRTGIPAGTVLTHYDLVVSRYGYIPAEGGLLNLFLCMFLHGSLLHLLGNMLYLWIFGDNVESRLGTIGYLIGYLGTGALATLAYAVMNAGSVTPLVGASGAISGVLGFYLLWFPQNRIRVLVFFFFITLVHIRALWVLGFYLIWDNLLPLLAARSQGGGGGGGGVAHGAHLGGFLAGMAGAMILNMLRGSPPRPGLSDPERRRREYRPRAVVESPSEAFAAAIPAGRMEDAAHAFARIAREGGAPPDPSSVFRLVRWLYENGFTEDAAAVFRYYIRHYPHGDDLDRVHLGLGILLARRLGQPVAAREHLLAAIDIGAGDAGIAATAREELRRIDGI